MEKLGMQDLGKKLFHIDDFEGIIAFAIENGAVIDEDSILEDKEWSLGSDNAERHLIADWCIDYVADNLMSDDVTIGRKDEWWFVADKDFWAKEIQAALGG